MGIYFFVTFACLVLVWPNGGPKVSIFSEFFFSVENRKKYLFSAEKTEKPKKSQKPKKPKILRGNPKKIAWKTEKIAQKTEKIVEDRKHRKMWGEIRILDFFCF